jgi:hypothetical protein
MPITPIALVYLGEAGRRPSVDGSAIAMNSRGELQS